MTSHRIGVGVSIVLLASVLFFIGLSVFTHYNQLLGLLIVVVAIVLGWVCARFVSRSPDDSQNQPNGKKEQVDNANTERKRRQ